MVCKLSRKAAVKGPEKQLFTHFNKSALYLQDGEPHFPSEVGPDATTFTLKRSGRVVRTLNASMVISTVQLPKGSQQHSINKHVYTMQIL